MGIANATQSGQSNGAIEKMFSTGTDEETDPGAPQAMDPITALVEALGKQTKVKEGDAILESDGSGKVSQEFGFSEDPRAAAKAQSSKQSAELDPALLEAMGGNVAMAAMIQNLNPTPEAMRAIRGGDSSAVLKMIEARKSELKEQMPALGLMEKVIDREGLDKVVGTASIAQLVAKFEDQYSKQNKIRKGSSTEDFLASKGVKIASLEPALDAVEGAELPGASLAGFGAAAGAGAGALTSGKALADGPLGAQNALRSQVPGNPQDALNNLIQGKNLDPNSPQVMASMNGKQAAARGANPADIPGSGKTGRLSADLGKSIDKKTLIDSSTETTPDGAQVLGAGAIGGLAAGEGAKNQQGYFETMNLADVTHENSRGNAVSRMAHNIGYVAKQGGGELKMIINPKDMGEVQLKVTTNGHRVEVEVIAQNSEVANILRSSTKELAEALSTQKLTLAGMEVSVKGGSASGEGNPQQQNFQNQNGSFANLNGNPSQHDGKGFQENFGGSDSRRGQEQAPAPAPAPAAETTKTTAAKKSSSRIVDLQA